MIVPAQSQSIFEKSYKACAATMNARSIVNGSALWPTDYLA